MVPCTIIQAPVCLVQKNRRFSNVPWLLKVSRSFASFTISWSFLPYRISPLTDWMWSAAENACLPVTVLIRLHLTRSKLFYLSFADVTLFCSPILAFFTENVLRAPTICCRVLGFRKKIQGKKVSCRTFSRPKDAFLYLLSRVEKYPLQLDRTCRCSVTLLKIFLWSLSQNVNDGVQPKMSPFSAHNLIWVN